MAPQNGRDDAYFIGQVRRILRDQPVWFNEPLVADGTLGTLTSTSKPFRLQRAPVMASGVVITAPGGPFGVDYNDSPPTPPTGRVNIVTDTGEVIFPAAPTAGTISITYQSVRYSDAQIQDALIEGLNLLWPEIWNPTVDTTTISPSPIVFEYDLPFVFQDQRVTLIDVEVAPPSAIVLFESWSTWRVVNDTVKPKLVFTRRPPLVGGQVRLTYAAPFASLSEPPSQVAYLPTYYAVARLLADQEVMRGRSDDLPALTGETASPAGTALNTASYWIDQFDKQLVKLGMDWPARRSVRDRAAERLGLRIMR